MDVAKPSAPDGLGVFQVMRGKQALSGRHPLSDKIITPSWMALLCLSRGRILSDVNFIIFSLFNREQSTSNHDSSFKPLPLASPRTVERHGRREAERPGWLERVLGGARGRGLMRPIATTRDKISTPLRFAFLYNPSGHLYQQGCQMSVVIFAPTTNKRQLRRTGGKR